MRVRSVGNRVEISIKKFGLTAKKELERVDVEYLRDRLNFWLKRNS